jgi:hypothetical protein
MAVTEEWASSCRQLCVILTFIDLEADLTYLWTGLVQASPPPRSAKNSSQLHKYKVVSALN